MSCNKSEAWDENGEWIGIDNKNACQWSGCFIGIKDGKPTYPYIYCYQCCMSNPNTGFCELGKRN